MPLKARHIAHLIGADKSDVNRRLHSEPLNSMVIKNADNEWFLLRKSGGKLPDVINYIPGSLANLDAPVYFIDYYRPYLRGGATHTPSKALLKFKDRDDFWVSRLHRAVGVVAAHLASQKMIESDLQVVPVLGSSDYVAPVDSPTVRLAAQIASNIGGALRLDLFSQSDTRERLHHGHKGAAERERLVDSVLQCNDCVGQGIVCVDDLITTGSTFRAYDRLIQRHGGSLVANFAIMRTQYASEVLNPELYADPEHPL